MVKSESEIKRDIKVYIDKEGSPYRTWYVGITNDPKHRLFNEHGVEEKNSWCIYREASSVEVARRVEDYFITLGTDGAPGGGDEDSKWVYAYRKTSYTNP